MASREVLLHVAAFLDSAEAQRLAEPARAQARGLLEAFLSVAFEELGKAPRLLDGEDLRAVLCERLPSHLGAADRRAALVPGLLAAFVDHLETRELVPHAYELRRALEEHAPAFLEAVRGGELAGRARVPQDPFVHGAAKLGRNDPCSCGSGKKYKKCHGKQA